MDYKQKSALQRDHAAGQTLITSVLPECSPRVNDDMSCWISLKLHIQQCWCLYVLLPRALGWLAKTL